MRVHLLNKTLSVAVFLLTGLTPLIPLRVVYAADPSAVVAQIRSASTSYLEALNSGDPDRIAACWTPHGTFVDADNATYRAQDLARQEFPKEGADRQQDQQRTVGEQQSMIRLITPGVALEQGRASVSAADPGANPTTSYFAIWVKTDESWLLDYLQELEVSTRPLPGPLAELQWMVGEWEAHSDEVYARLTVTWSDERRYLLQRYTVQLPDQAELRGEQRITWDAANKQIRSWLFRSDGGFGEGVWQLEGDAWVVKKSEVLPSGEKNGTVNLWVNEDPDSCWFKSLTASVGDQPAAGLVLQFRRLGSH